MSALARPMRSRKLTPTEPSCGGSRDMLKGAIEHATENTAEIYDRAGAAYSAYADGDPSQIFDFSGPHAQADRCVWSCLAAKLAELRISGAPGECGGVGAVDKRCGACHAFDVSEHI